MRAHSSSASCAVRIARTCTDVWTMSGSTPAAREIRAAAPGFLATMVGEVDVDPPGEEVLQVPVALAVAQQHERGRHGHSSSGSWGGVRSMNVVPGILP